MEEIAMTQSDLDEMNAARGKIIAKAWRDPVFKATLLANPYDVLKKAGLHVQAGVAVKVVENTDQRIHLVLPPNPSINAGRLFLRRANTGQVPY